MAAYGTSAAGASATLLKIAINISFRFLMYRQLVEALEREWDAHATLGAWGRGEGWRFSAVSMLAGGVVGAVTVVGNHPIDVVKSNMQSVGGARRFASATQCLRAIYAEQGARGLYRGLAPRLNRVVLETSLSFTLYEHFSRACNEAFPE